MWNKTSKTFEFQICFSTVNPSYSDSMWNSSLTIEEMWEVSISVLSSMSLLLLARENTAVSSASCPEQGAKTI